MAEKKNSEGYSDPTAYGGMIAAEKAEAMIRIKKMMDAIKAMAEENGFEINNRIIFRDKETGKIYR